MRGIFILLALVVAILWFGPIAGWLFAAAGLAGLALWVAYIFLIALTPVLLGIAGLLFYGIWWFVNPRAATVEWRANSEQWERKRGLYDVRKKFPQ